ncbi:MAG: 30S ribosomal protein S4e [Candidatus Woesearchaeota archaeon]
MAKAHLKRLNAPRTWKIKRKGIKFITRPNPGPHAAEMCMPINIVLRDMLGYASNAKQVKYMLAKQQILVDGKQRKDPKFPVGLMDVISLPLLKESYRMIIDEKGFLRLLKIDSKEASIKPCKVLNKTRVKGGKTQLNLSSGINLIAEKDEYKCGGSLLVELPSKKIKKNMQFDVGSYIFLTGGKHIGDHGVIEKISEEGVYYKSKSGGVVKTEKRFALVVGEKTPGISLG